MRNMLSSLFVLSILVLAVFCIAGFAGLNTARAQDCGIGIGKQADGAGDLEFQFTTQGPNGNGEFTLTDGKGTGGPFTDFIEIRELPTQGWVLHDIQCESEGVTITKFSDGFRVDCDEQSGGGECIFINVPFSGTNIPTLSEWGMIAAVLGFGFVGVFFAMRRKRVVV